MSCLRLVFGEREVPLSRVKYDATKGPSLMQLSCTSNAPLRNTTPKDR